jgi:hypothetical protein
MDMEKQPKKRIMTEETKAMLKQKRKEKTVKLKELEKKIEIQNSVPQEIPKEPFQRAPGPEFSKPAPSHSNFDAYNYNHELKIRLSNLENLMMQSKNDIFEIKTRKEIKDRLKAKKAEIQEEKEKTIDKEEVKKVKYEMNRVNHEIQGLEYSNLFY